MHWLKNSNEAYHSGQEVGSSSLKLLAQKSPAHLKAQKKVESEALRWGTLVHDFVLEKSLKLAIAPVTDKRTKAYKEFVEANWDSEIITADEYEALKAIEDALKKHRIASEMFLPGCVYETSGYTTIDGVQVRIRPDVRNPNERIIWDLKTSRDCDVKSFTRDCLYNLRYDIQAALYTDVAEILDGAPYTFRWCVVEKEAPYAINVFEASLGTIEQGRASYKEALEVYKKCLELNQWPSYSEVLQWI